MKKDDPVEGFKNVARRYMVLDGAEYIDVIFGACFANRLDEAPTWIHVIGPPSSGKTSVLASLNGHETIHVQNSVSRRSMISGLDKKNEGTALLPKLDGKVLVIPDFTVLFGLRSDELHEILAYFRQIYDGILEKHITGVGCVKHEVEFGFLTGVTNAIDRHKRALGDLGERFVSYRMRGVSAVTKRRASLKAMGVVSERERKDALKKAAHRVLDSQPDVPIVDRSILKEIVYIAEFATKARAEVPRDRYSKDPGEVEDEHLGRISNQLLNLSRGIAMAHGRRRVVRSDLKVAQKSAFHSATRSRIRLMRLMLGRREWMDVEGVRERMRLSEKGAQILLEDLELVGLAEREEVETSKGGEKFQWRLKDRRMLRRVLG